MNKKLNTQTTLNSLLLSNDIRRFEREGRTWFSVHDVVAYLADSEDSSLLWAELKDRQPELRHIAERVDTPMDAMDAVDLVGLLRIAQEIDSPRARHIKAWMARAAQDHLHEAEDPELAILRAHRVYEQRGNSRQWIDSRLSTTSARQDLVGEWYRRGAREGEQFRVLTNELFISAFGMNVNDYRQFKHLRGSGQNLRDNMTDLELALTRLGEITAAALHRDRHSRSFEHLLRDVRDAGEVTATARAEIEIRRGKPVVCPGSVAA